MNDVGLFKQMFIQCSLIAITYHIFKQLQDGKDLLNDYCYSETL